MEIQPKEDLHKATHSQKMEQWKCVVLKNCICLPTLLKSWSHIEGEAAAAAPELSGQNTNPTQRGFNNR